MQIGESVHQEIYRMQNAINHENYLNGYFPVQDKGQLHGSRLPFDKMGQFAEVHGLGLIQYRVTKKDACSGVHKIQKARSTASSLLDFSYNINPYSALKTNPFSF
jgi:hypothetical protein